MTALFDPITLADFATEMVSLHDANGMFLTISPACHDLFGYHAEELEGRRLSDLVHPEDARLLETAFDGVPGEPRTGAVSTTCRLRHGDDYWAWFEVTVRPAPGGLEGATVVSTRSATELVAARQSSQWAQETLRQVFDHSPAPMAIIGLDQRFERVNPAFCALLDTPPDQLIGRALDGFLDGGDTPADRFALTELACGRLDQLTGTQSFLRAGGSAVTVTTRRSVSHSATGRQQVILHVLAEREVAAVLVPAQARPEQHSTDREPVRAVPEGVTGLTSRPLLLDRLNVAATREDRSTQFLVMFFVVVQDSRRILDRQGRHALDGVLTKTGNRLRSMLRGDDTVARFGDRGFVVLCPAVGTSADVVTIRQRMTRAVSDGAVLVDGRKFKVSAQVGAAIVGPGEAWEAHELLGRADAEMA